MHRNNENNCSLVIMKSNAVKILSEGQVKEVEDSVLGLEQGVLRGVRIKLPQWKVSKLRGYSANAVTT